MPVPVRWHAATVACLLVAVVSGCARPSDGSGANTAAPGGAAAAASRPLAPAYEAGGACALLDFDQIRQAVGIGFGVAAASKRGDTYTCVVQPSGAAYPDLTLSVSATTVDDRVFTSSLVPAGAEGVSDLGRVGYRVALPGTAEAGPGVEIGWLAGNRRLLMLRLHTALGAAGDQATTTQSGLAELAKTIDFASA